MAKRFDVNPPALVAIRMRTGISQRKLAKAVGVDPSYIAQVEAEHCECSDRIIMAIARELSVPVDAIATVRAEASA